ncbi:thioredoxin-like protein [Gaertneriomyces semiglobifer]|nr:thioredoxin-like protein [Gaertneriomyces semiglobifer]
MAPVIGKPAPAFTLKALHNGEFKTISLSDYKGQYVVLFFYPMDFTFVCPTEIIAFNDLADKFASLNTTVLAASTDTIYSHLAWTSQPRSQGGVGTLSIPLLSDITKSLSTSYGVLIQDGEDAGVALRGTFIIDPHGILRIAHVNDNGIGREVGEYVRLVEALRFHEEFGEVCPAGWQKGGRTIKADPKASKEYFGAVAAPQ